MEKVAINDNWKDMFNEDTNLESSDIDSENIKDTYNISEELVMKTLLHGFTDSHSIYDLENKQIKIAQWELFHKDHDFYYPITNFFIKKCILFLIGCFGVFGLE